MEYLSIPHYRGLKEKYNEATHSDGLYFTTDTHEIFANGASYSTPVSFKSWDVTDGVLTLTLSNDNAVTITFDEASETAKGMMSAQDKKKLNAFIDSFDTLTAAIEKAQGDIDTHKEDVSNPHQVTKEQVELGNVTNDAQVKRTEMGVANGVATLDENGFVPSAQLPSYVDDVLEYETFSKLPTSGEEGKIYVTTDDNLTYRWSGTQYVEISASLALGETNSTAYAGDKGKQTTDYVTAIKDTTLTHIDQDDTFEATEDSVTFKFEQYTGDQFGGTPTSASTTIPVATTTTAGIITATDKAAIDDITTHINNKENPHEVTKEQIELGNVTNDAQVKRDEMGVADGVATLDTDGKVPLAQLPYNNTWIDVE